MNGVPPGASPDSVPVRPVVELTPQWAEAVGRKILDVADSDSEHDISATRIDECWVGADLAIYVRHRLGTEQDYRVGRRIADPHIDPTSCGYALDAHSQAVYLYYDLPGPPDPSWIDHLGYRWYGSGPEPTPSWEAAVERQPRVVTLRQRTEEPS
jgi:hypothetical protein